MRVPLDVLPSGWSDVRPSQHCVSALWYRDKNIKQCTLLNCLNWKKTSQYMYYGTNSIHTLSIRPE